MEKHNPCSGQLDCQKWTTAVFIIGVKLGNSNCCFCFMCLCLWISGVWVLSQLVSSGLILLSWLVLSLALLISLEHQKLCETITLLKTEIIFPNIFIILDNHCCSRIFLKPLDLKIAVLVAHCSIILRSTKLILDPLVCRCFKPSPWCKEAVVSREREAVIWNEQNREGKEDFSCRAGE